MFQDIPTLDKNLNHNQDVVGIFLKCLNEAVAREKKVSRIPTYPRDKNVSEIKYGRCSSKIQILFSVFFSL